LIKPADRQTDKLRQTNNQLGKGDDIYYNNTQCVNSSRPVHNRQQWQRL